MAPRRGHRKSRHGCAECKRRHVKCDETHPICINCTNTRRPCSFQALTPSTMGGPSPVPAPDQAGLSPGVPGQHPLDVPAMLVSHYDMSTVPPAHMDQLRLLQHYLSGAIPVFDKMPSPHNFIEGAFDKPYLMNVILAFSARHLASLHPETASHYVFLAREYQAHALSSFNGTHVESTPDNCMQLIVFSWMVGMNLLCDVECVEDDGDVLDDFIRYIELFRGVRVIASTAWAALRESELASVVRDGEVIADQLSEGAETESLQALIKDSLGMDDDQKEGNREALARIQATYGACAVATPGAEGLSPTPSAVELMDNSITMALAWPQMITPGFVVSLQAKRPETLLVLAHFAVLMHWCRRHWIVGSVGSRLLRSIVMALGPGWERWLQWPRAMVEGHGDTATPCDTAEDPST